MEDMIEKHETEHPKVSIIVPVYKVEKYLPTCLHSIASQTYENLEVILVDDGSPDRCSKICDTFVQKHAYAKVIHQTNQGQAAARNNAVKIATGEFISFIDSDDYVERDYIEYLVSLQRAYEADVVIGGFHYMYEGESLKPHTYKEAVRVMKAEEALIRLNYNVGYGATPWAKLYKKELILSHPFPVGQIYEDLAVIYKIIGDCNVVVFGNKRIYNWLQRAGSTMRMNFDERQMAGMDAVSEQIHYLESRYNGAVQAGKYRYAAKSIELVTVCMHSGGDRDVFRRLRDLTKKYSKEVLKDKHAKTTMKARIAAVMLGYYPAKIVIALHENTKQMERVFIFFNRYLRGMRGGL